MPDIVGGNSDIIVVIFIIMFVFPLQGKLCISFNFYD